MSSKPIVIALVLCILLAAGVLFTLAAGGSKGGATTAGPTVTVGEPVMDLDIQKVKKLAVSVEGRATDVAERGSDGTTWTLKTKDAMGTGETVWPADFLRIRVFLRELSTARATGKPEAGATIPDSPPPTVVTMTMDDGSERTLRFAGRTLGGQAKLEIRDTAAKDGASPTRMAIVSDALLQALVTPGPRGWRETQLLPGVSINATSLKLTSTGGGAKLQRVMGRWALVEPVAGPADQGVVLKMLSVLENLRAERFVDGSLSKKDAGLENPAATAVVGFESRAAADASGGKPATELRRELKIGGPADASGANLYASVNDGPPVVVDAKTLRLLTVDPAKLLSSQSVQTPKADIGLVTIAPLGSAGGSGGTPLRYKRTVQGWAELDIADKELLLEKARSDDVEALLTLLTQTTALATLVEAPKDWKPTAEITLAKVGGVLDKVECGTADGRAFVVRNDKIWRAYDAKPKIVP